jgi:hypothetical protein
MVNFAGAHSTRSLVGLDGDPLVLEGLEKLSSLNGATHSKLPTDIQTAFEDRPMKVVVLNDKSDLAVRFDLFERLNTGGLALTAQEVRECVYRGPFMELLRNLAATPDFKQVVILPENSWRDGTPEEYVLRFFAFLERYEYFDHSVKDFLNDFTKSATASPDLVDREAAFTKTFSVLAKTFPEGLRTRKGMTPVNLFEGVAVGCALALKRKRNLKSVPMPNWVTSAELRALTTGATNSRTRVAGRIEHCRDQFISHHV